MNTLHDRFFRKVDMRGPDECWQWIGCKNVRGYGRFGIGGRAGGTVLAHRASYQLFVGDIPTGMVVLHTCDNPSCVNPNHLTIGTQSDNLADMRIKRRHRWGERPRGEGHRMAKLTLEQVNDIRTKRQQGRTIQSLADEFGVSGGNVHFIVSGRTWR